MADNQFSFAAVDKITGGGGSGSNKSNPTPTSTTDNQFSFKAADAVLKKTTSNTQTKSTADSGVSFATVDKVLGKKTIVKPVEKEKTVTPIINPVDIPPVNTDFSTPASTPKFPVADKGTKMIGDLVTAFKEAPGGLLNQMAKTIRATTQLLATPIAGILGLGERTTKENVTQGPSKTSTPSIVDAHNESTLAIPAMKESLLMAKNMLLDEKVPVSQGVNDAAQMYLKRRGIGKYGGKDPGVADIAMLTFLGFSDLFGDPAFEAAAGLKAANALKEFATFRKVGTATRDLAEVIPGVARDAKIVNPIEHTIDLTDNLRLKVKPQEGEVVFEGYVRRFAKDTNVKGFLPGTEEAAAAAQKAAEPDFQVVKDLVSKMSEGSPMDISASLRGEDLVLKPQLTQETLKTVTGAARAGETSKVSAEAANASPEAAGSLANEPITPDLLNRLKTLNPEANAAFGRKIVEDLSSKLGVDLNSRDLNLPDSTSIKTTRSVDGRPAQITSSGKIEVYLPNLVDDIKSLAKGNTVLAHDGAYATIFKMQPGESMSSLATRYLSDVLTHEQAHAETISVSDQSTQRQLQQKVYEATASKNPKAVTEAKTNLENFMRTLEDKANAYEKANKSALQKKVFGGRTVDVTDLVKQASRESKKSIINKAAGVTKPAEKVTRTDRQLLKNKLSAEQRASQKGFSSGRNTGEAQGRNAVENVKTEAQRKAELDSLKQRIKDRSRANAQKEKIKSRYETAIESIKDKAATIEAKRKELINYTDLLPQKSRAKFIRAINNMKTDKQFLDVIERIKAESNTVERVGLIKDIQSELKGTIIKSNGRFPNPKFAYEAQKTLNSIRANINGNYAQAQVDMAAKIADFQTKNPDALIPDELVRELQMLKAVGIKDMSAAELRSVLQDIKSLKESGRTKLELERFNRDAEIDRAKDKVFEILTGGKPLPSEAGYFKRGNYTPPKGNLLEGFKDFITTGRAPLQEVLDAVSKLDRGSKPNESFLSKEVMRRVNESFNIENPGEMKQIAKFNEAVKEIYKTKNNKEIMQLYADLSKPRTIYNVPDVHGQTKDLVLSRDEAIDIYMKMQDPTLEETFKEGMGWGDKTFEAVKAILTPEDIKYAEWQLDNFYPEYYKGINDTFVREFGVDLPFNERYSPLGRDVEVRIPESVLMAQEASKYASVKNGSLKNRVKSKLDIKVVGSTTNAMQHIAKMEHYKAWSENITFLRRVFGDKDVRQALVDFHGKQTLRYFDNVLNDLARGGVDRGTIIPWVDSFRSNITRALLGINPKVAVKQLAGIFNYMIDIPAKDFFGGIYDFWQAPLEKSRFLYNNSPGLAERFGEGFDRDIKFAIKRNVGRQISNTRNFGEQMFALIRNADKFTVFHGSWATFASKYEELAGKPFDLKKYDPEIVKEAIDYTDNVTNRVQESSRLDTLAPVQRMGSVMKLFTMFASQPNKMFGITMSAFRNYYYKRGSRAENLKIALMAGWVLPFIYNFISNQLVPDKYKKSGKRLAVEAAFGPLQYPLIIGQIVQSVLGKAFGDRFNYSATPATAIVDDVMNSAAVFTGQDFTKSLTYLIDAMGKAGGVPTTIVTKPIRNSITNSKDKGSSGGGTAITF